MTPKKPSHEEITSILRGRASGRAPLRPMRSAAVLIAAMLVGVIVPAAAQAAPGDLDPTFSGDGLQTTAFLDNDRANGVAIQTNGKIVAVGGTSWIPDVEISYFALARYNPNGTLDPSFSGDGMQTTRAGGNSGASDVAIQPNGKIVAVGSNSAGSGGNFALARYNPNGTLDPSFSGDGLQTTNFGGRCGASAVALQGDGKIVVVGNALKRISPSNIKPYFALARYNPNGSLDKTFSGDGKQMTPFVGNGAVASDVAIQGNGKIVAAGGTEDAAGNGDFALARYNPNGTLDPTFSGDGKQRTNFGGGYDGARGVALQGAGKIVAVGSSGNGYDFALARYNPNGTLDPTFSGDGMQTTDFAGGNDGAYDVVRQGDGEIVAVGYSSVAFDGDFALARYKFNGTLDTSFSGDGMQTTDFGSSGDEATAVALQGDGRIVAVGESSGDFALARYLGG